MSYTGHSFGGLISLQIYSQCIQHLHPSRLQIFGKEGYEVKFYFGKLNLLIWYYYLGSFYKSARKCLLYFTAYKPFMNYLISKFDSL